MSGLQWLPSGGLPNVTMYTKPRSGERIELKMLFNELFASCDSGINPGVECKSHGHIIILIYAWTMGKVAQHSI